MPVRGEELDLAHHDIRIAVETEPGQVQAGAPAGVAFIDSTGHRAAFVRC